LAAEKGHKAIVILLLEHGADANIVDNEGHSLVSLATEKGNKEMLVLLLEHGADPTVVDHNGCTLLHLAARCVPETVALLLEHGAVLFCCSRCGIINL
jgi:ankyrin repeat protein